MGAAAGTQPSSVARPSSSWPAAAAAEEEEATGLKPGARGVLAGAPAAWLGRPVVDPVPGSAADQGTRLKAREVRLVGSVAQGTREGLEASKPATTGTAVGAVGDALVLAAAGLVPEVAVVVVVAAVRPAIRPMAAQPAKPLVAQPFTRLVMD